MGQRTTNTSKFSIYDLPVRYVVDSPTLMDPVNELLTHFRRDSIEASAALTVHFQTVQTRATIPLALSSSARRLSAGTGSGGGGQPKTALPYEVMQDKGRLIADFHDAGILVIDCQAGTADGYLIEPETMSVNLIEYLFHLALIELLRHRRLYTVHAAALEKDGRGILIPGTSGRGKTTSFISLLRSGYRYLSDDHPLLRDAGAYVEVLPFPTRIKATPRTIAFFPELLKTPNLVPLTGSAKRSFQATDLYPTGVGDDCRLAVVLFPNIVDTPRSHLEPLPKHRALELLLPQALLVYDPEVASREFHVLAKLVQQVDCYRLYFGRDVLDLPQLITPLLEHHT